MSKKLLQNLAGTHLVVSSIEVLEDISGSGIKEIKKDISALQNETRKFEIEQEDYWSSLSADGIITAFEKKTINKEYKGIERSYDALFQQATSQDLTGTVEWQWYDEAFNELKTYLFNTLNLFNDMEADTVIPDRAVFDSKFSAYYFQEKYVTLALAMGIMGNLGFRSLENLQEPGEEGEIGFYKGVIYQYTDGVWLPVGLEGYVGAKDSLPEASLNQYFIVSEEFKVSQQVVINGENLLINNEEFYVNQIFELGYIYVYDGTFWVKISDKSDYRYVVAMVDLVTITGELPGVFQEAIDDASEKLKKDIDKNTASIADEIRTRSGQYTVISGQIVVIDNRLTTVEGVASGAVKHIPEYLGSVKSPASLNPKEGDFFVYEGSTLGQWVNSEMYVYRKGSWQWLDPEDTFNRDYYMLGLQDILLINKAGTGYFTQLFCNAFWANEITTNNLETKEITLRQDGCVKSANWDGTTERGLYIGSDGKIYIYGSGEAGAASVVIGTSNKPASIIMNGSGHFSGDVETDGNLKCHGTTRLDGDVIIGSVEKPVGLHANGLATFRGELIAATGSFTGDLETYGELRAHGITRLDGDVEIGSKTEPVEIHANANATFSGELKAASGSFSGDISAATGTFTGLIKTSGLNIKGFTAGNAFSLGSTHISLESIDYHPAKKWTSAGQGVLRIYYSGQATLAKIYKNDTAVVTFENETKSGHVDITVNPFDVISIQSNNGRTDTANINIELCVSEENYLLKFLSRWEDM